MTLDDLKNLLNYGESKTLEFKKSLAGLETAGKTLCGFLNQPHGGMVLIGINNHSKIVGQEITDSMLKKIAAFLNHFDPQGRVDVDYVSVTGNSKVIIFKANPMAHEQPYSYDGKYYERVESTTQRLSHEYIRFLFLESGDAAKIWGEQTSDCCKLDDLDFDEIKTTIRQGVGVRRIDPMVSDMEVEDVLYHLKLMTNGKLTNSAIVLFAKDIETFLPQCKIRLARFRGSDKYSEIIDSQVFYGNAFQTLGVAEEFIRKHHFVSSRFQADRLERIDEPTLPFFAVREALINAICHRNYRDRGTAIALAIYDDHTEIWNSGKLLPGWTLDKLKQRHISDPRNELIAKMFYLRDYIENWGMGVKKILDECKKVGLPEPKYDEYSNGISISFWYKEPIGMITTKTAKAIVISKRQQTILSILSEHDFMALREIIDVMPEKVHERLIRDDLYALKELGKVDITGHGRGAVWSLRKISG